MALHVAEATRMLWSLFEIIAASQCPGFSRLLESVFHKQMRAFLENRAGVTRVIEACRLKFFENNLCSKPSLEYSKVILTRVIETGWIVGFHMLFPPFLVI